MREMDPSYRRGLFPERYGHGNYGGSFVRSYKDDPDKVNNTSERNNSELSSERIQYLKSISTTPK